MRQSEILALLKATGNYLCTSAARVIERQESQIETMYEVIDILRKGYGGHQHWDATQQHGAGCEICKQQWEARDMACEILKQFEDKE